MPTNAPEGTTTGTLPAWVLYGGIGLGVVILLLIVIVVLLARRKK
jgi:hypothetical protein